MKTVVIAPNTTTTETKKAGAMMKTDLADIEGLQSGLAGLYQP